MKKNLTEMVFILDRSGSMSGLESDTIGGFNAMLARQRREEGEALVSTVMFSTESQVIHDRADVKTVRDLTLDLSGVTFMDSAGLGVILGRYRILSMRGGHLTVSGMSGAIDKIFRMSGVYAIVDRV